MSPARWLAVLALILCPAAACGPGGSVYVGVSAPGPWVGYPGGYYPGSWGYPGYRWEEEEDDGEDDGPELLEWTAPWSATPDPVRPTPEEDS
jgi:hypothetical protein